MAKHCLVVGHLRVQTDGLALFGGRTSVGTD